jgi:hypothetical protein
MKENDVLNNGSCTITCLESEKVDFIREKIADHLETTETKAELLPQDKQK